MEQPLKCIDESNINSNGILVKRFPITHKVYNAGKFIPKANITLCTKLQSQMDLKWHKRISIDKSLRIASEWKSSKDEPIKFSHLNANTQTAYSVVSYVSKGKLWNVFLSHISLWLCCVINLFANMLMSNIVSRKEKNSRINKEFECRILDARFQWRWKWIKRKFSRQSNIINKDETMIWTASWIHSNFH